VKTTDDTDGRINGSANSADLRAALFGKERRLSSLWRREAERVLTGECHSIPENRSRHTALTFFIIFSLFTFHVSLFTVSSEAAIFDRVVAFVDDRAITLSGLREQYEATKKMSPGVTEEEVLDTMINRILLLREAKKYRIEAPTDQQMLDEYIDLKVRAFIKVSEADIEEFYARNRDRFAGKTYEDVREEIENYLTEKELNARLKEALKQLRRNAYIRIQLRPDR
jgi:hypothetical protein